MEPATSSFGEKERESLRKFLINCDNFEGLRALIFFGHFLNRPTSEQEVKEIQELRDDYSFWAERLQNQGYQLPENAIEWLKRFNNGNPSSIRTALFELVQDQERDSDALFQPQERDFDALFQPQELTELFLFYDSVQKMIESQFRIRTESKLISSLKQTLEALLSEFELYREQEFIRQNLLTQRRVLIRRHKKYDFIWHGSIPRVSQFKSGPWSEYIKLVSSAQDFMSEFYPLDYEYESLILLGKILREGDWIQIHDQETVTNHCYFISNQGSTLFLSRALDILVDRGEGQRNFVVYPPEAADYLRKLRPQKLGDFTCPEIISGFTLCDNDQLHYYLWPSMFHPVEKIDFGGGWTGIFSEVKPLNVETATKI